MLDPALTRLIVDMITGPQPSERTYSARLERTGLSIMYGGWRLAGVVGFDGRPTEGKRETPFRTIDEAGQWFDKNK